MGVLTSKVDHTSATTGRGDHEVDKGHVVAWEGGEFLRDDFETFWKTNEQRNKFKNSQHYS
jgi:hypothetical protein